MGRSTIEPPSLFLLFVHSISPPVYSRKSLLYISLCIGFTVLLTIPSCSPRRITDSVHLLDHLLFFLAWLGYCLSYLVFFSFIASVASVVHLTLFCIQRSFSLLSLYLCTVRPFPRLTSCACMTPCSAYCVTSPYILDLYISPIVLNVVWRDNDKIGKWGYEEDSKATISTSPFGSQLRDE